MLGLLAFAVIATGYFIFMLNIFKHVGSNFRIAGYLLIAFNNLVLLTGMLKNPGIPQGIFDKHLKD